VAQTQRFWEDKLTFFPQFLAVLRQRMCADATVAAVGVSDGKFVLPPAAMGCSSWGLSWANDAGGGRNPVPAAARSLRSVSRR